MARGAATLAGRYELLEVIGRGGMGVVYRGRDRVLERTVAVKVLPALFGEDPTLVERFEREARAVARLSHPNIVSVYDSGRDGDQRFMVMECVPGMSLAQLLGERGRREPPEAVEIATQIAAALAAAHAAGIIHRDIKPANVMVLPSGHVKVLDFGIARAAADVALTRATMVLGSAPYLAPEVALGQPADERSDIYSLGCVLYEMLTGRPPFRGDLPAAVMNQHINETPQPPRELAPAIPAALEALVLQMLAKEPERRPQHASDLGPALRATLTAPTAATAPTAPTAPTAATVPVAPIPAPTAPAAATPRTAPAAPRPRPPVPPTMAAGPPAAGPGRPPRRGVTPWLIAALLVLVLAAGVAVAAISSSGSNASRSSTSRSSTPRSSSTPTASSTTSSTAQSTSTPTTRSTTTRTTTSTATAPPRTTTTTTTTPPVTSTTGSGGTALP